MAGPYGSTAMKTSLTPSGGRISDLDADYGRCKAAVAKRDTYLQNAVAYGGGLRILRQDLWGDYSMLYHLPAEQYRADYQVCRKFVFPFRETCYNKSEQVYNSIPTAERLAACTPEESCAGAPRLPRQIHLRRGTAGRVRCGRSEAVRHMDYAHAKAELLRLTGVGIKVAECICLFALHHIDAFPVDTHISLKCWTHTIRKGFR